MKMSSIIQFDICSIYTTIRYMHLNGILTRHVRSTISSSINALALLENSIFSSMVLKMIQFDCQWSHGGDNFHSINFNLTFKFDKFSTIFKVFIKIKNFTFLDEGSNP